MRRREFILALGGVAVALPLPAYAQQPERIRRIGMLTEFSEAQMQPLVAAFRQQLQQLGWRDGSFTIDLRFAIADAAQFAAMAAALIATSPDIIIALGSRALRRSSHRRCARRAGLLNLRRETDKMKAKLFGDLERGSRLALERQSNFSPQKNFLPDFALPRRSD